LRKRHRSINVSLLLASFHGGAFGLAKTVVQPRLAWDGTERSNGCRAFDGGNIVAVKCCRTMATHQIVQYRF